MEFLHWVTLYNDIFTELFGEDKEAAMKVVNDDAAFDAWLTRYSNTRKNAHKNNPKGNKVTKAQYFARIRGALPKPRGKHDRKDRKPA